MLTCKTNRWKLVNLNSNMVIRQDNDTCSNGNYIGFTLVRTLCNKPYTNGSLPHL